MSSRTLHNAHRADHHHLSTALLPETSSLNVLVGIDETSGIQNATYNGVTSNDVASSLPAPFTTALGFETLAGSTNPVTATALSGATATSTSGTQVITFTGTVRDVGFTDSTGAPVAGLDSGITTAAGREIYLYTSSHDNNVLLGREATSGGLADPAGAVAFALYLDTGSATSSDAGATGAKLWVKQYEAFHQGDGSDANDFVTLAQDLFITVDTQQDFSLKDAPAGQNLFMMFGDGTPAAGEAEIIVTGMHPSTTGSVTAGDTVNTGHGGGGTTIGTNNQMIDPNEGMYFTFVKGANVDYTVPNLDQNEADHPVNLQFDSYLTGARAASFDVAQLQPPKGATILITAINNTGTDEKGATFVAGLGDADDQHVNIDSVTITRLVKTGKVVEEHTYTFTSTSTQGGITVDFTGDTAKVTGVVSGDHVAYHTVADHNRVLIDNVGNTDAKLNSAFDIGGFQVDTGSHAPIDLGNVAFIDDAPIAEAAQGTGAVTHDETAGLQSASGANDTASTSVSDLFTSVSNFSTQLTAAYAQGSASVIDASASSFGADGAAATGSKVYSLEVASAGVDSGLATDDGTHIYLYKEGDLVVGRIGGSSGEAALAVSIDASTGVLSMAQYSAIAHGDHLDANDLETLTATALKATVTVKDADGDTHSDSVDIGDKVGILDDAPVADAALGTGSVTHDETAGEQSAAGANDTASSTVSALFTGVTNTSTQLAAAYAQGSASVIDSSASSFGADGAAATGSTVYSLDVASAGVDSGLTTDDGTIIKLYKEGDLVVGRIGADETGHAAFAVAIDAGTGVLSMAQYSAIAHGDDGDANELETLTASALQAVVTVKDADGDTHSDSVDIGDKVGILDDAPVADAALGTGSVTHDETAGEQSAGGANDTSSSTVSALFTSVSNFSTQLTAAYAQGSASVIDSSGSSFGADGAAATGSAVYSLDVASAGVDSGLTTDDGTHIYLYKEGDLVVGRIGSSSGAAALAVSIDASTGVLSMAQYSAIAHGDHLDANDLETLTATALKATVTVKDADGDTHSDSVDIGDKVGILDDGPTADAALGTGSVTHDETAGEQSASGANDTASATVAALFTGVTNTSSQLTAAYAQGSASVIDSSGSSFGSDGAAATGSTAYSLDVASAGVDSGLTTDDGTIIKLYKEGDLVVGRIGADETGHAAFAVAINSSTGVLSMAQYSAIAHGDSADANDLETLTASALQAVVTVKDADGDTHSDSVDIGDKVGILDDAPVADAALGAGSVTHDETAGEQSASGANDTASATVAALFTGVTNTSTQLTAAYAQGSASVIDSSGSSFGADGAAATGSKVYSLDVASAGVASGLTTDDGTVIKLYKEGDLVVGRIGADQTGHAAFAVAINSSTGVLSMAQYSAIEHGNSSDANDLETLTATALKATVTVKDGDGDTHSDTVDIGDKVGILDDGPTLAFGDLIGTGTLNPQYGTWSMSAGSDGIGGNGVDVSMTGFQLVHPDGTTVNGTSYNLSESSTSPDSSGNYHFSGSVTGDLDNKASTPDITEHFTMTVFANGTYNIDLVEGFLSTTTESTAGGSLDAGGPDAVRTLTVGSDHIVFFAANPTASASDLITYGTELGAPDFTEAQLETAHPAIIDFAHALNVSTSGIGTANNNLQGDSNAAIGAGDESFVANPGTQFTSAKVFIDNAVTGYDYTHGERLYYRILYADGTDSGQVLVTSDVATTGHVASPFTIDGGGKLIDAIQLTMATGTVKVPEIQFITETNNLVNGLKLSFHASVADNDGDTAGSDFVANLAANTLGATFDYVLHGTASALDWFNVDLAQPHANYQVNGFDTGANGDKLVLLGDAGATFDIDNSGADSVVTVHETGGLTTTVTVVGVDLLTTDIMLHS